MRWSCYYPGQKKLLQPRYSWDWSAVRSSDIMRHRLRSAMQRELATRRVRESRRCRTKARYRTISHDRTVDQPHEFLGCNDFFGQGSKKVSEIRVFEGKMRRVCHKLIYRKDCSKKATAQLKQIFVLRKKGSKTKKTMKEEEIEKSDCGLPTPEKSDPVVYPAYAFDSCLRGD